MWAPYMRARLATKRLPVLAAKQSVELRWSEIFMSAVRESSPCANSSPAMCVARCGSLSDRGIEPPLPVGVVAVLAAAPAAAVGEVVADDGAAAQLPLAGEGLLLGETLPSAEEESGDSATTWSSASSSRCALCCSLATTIRISLSALTSSLGVSMLMRCVSRSPLERFSRLSLERVGVRDTGTAKSDERSDDEALAAFCARYCACIEGSSLASRARSRASRFGDDARRKCERSMWCSFARTRERERETDKERQACTTREGNEVKAGGGGRGEAGNNEQRGAM